MSDTKSNRSTHLALPYLQPSQAQKHVIHNEALEVLDAVTQLSVISMTQADAPSAPEQGDRYILPAAASGAWAGQDAGGVAHWQGNGWRFLVPAQGWRAWVSDTQMMAVFDGGEWTAATIETLEQLGIGTSADMTNRLAVAAPATLLTHEGAGHQIKVNKSSPNDTASILFQTGWSGRAEMGTVGADDFAIKISADGANFREAMIAEADTGQVRFPHGAKGLAPDDFGDSPLVTASYINARGLDLVANGTGLLGNGYNYPDQFTYDPVMTPNLAGSASYAGYYPGVARMSERLSVDPNQIYRLSCYMRQEGLNGDWSAFNNAERHTQYMGLQCLDIDGTEITARQHMRYRQGGIDSLTTLAAPLAPGDTQIQLENAAGWNETSAANYNRGVIMFGYRNSYGALYDFYSHLTALDLFDLGQVDKSANTVTLKVPFPTSLANPDDPSGVWPVGTRLANSSSGSNYKYAYFSGLLAPELDRWYRTETYVGGIDLSGTNQLDNFPPGTAYVTPFWLPNYSNRPGGWSTFPDTGPDHRVWFAGVSLTDAPMGVMHRVQSGPNSGAADLQVAQADPVTGVLGLAPHTLSVIEI